MQSIFFGCDRTFMALRYIQATSHGNKNNSNIALGCLVNFHCAKSKIFMNFRD